MTLCTHCTSQIHPVVAVDIDGTLGDYHRHFMLFAAEWLGLPSTVVKQWQYDFDGIGKLARTLGITDETYRTIKLAYRQGGMKRSMPLLPGAGTFMDWLYEEGVEIWVTTTRPYMRLDNIDPDTREWLRRNGIRFNHLMYDEHKYQRLAQLVDPSRIVAVLEDQADMYDEAIGAGLPALLVQGQYNRAVQREFSVADLVVDGIATVQQLLEDWRTHNAHGS